MRIIATYINSTIPCKSFDSMHCIFTVSAFTVFGSNWDVVANPSNEDIQFMAAVNVIVEAFFRIASELPMYRLYNNKLSRDLKAAFEVSGHQPAHTYSCQPSQYW